ncbi:heme ABC transporter ATP-binding protein [candidate division WOR-3 bacterium]|nr:heme ABC transporter ATP-binding protein [candidate division WOR-3 bacterium]
MTALETKEICFSYDARRVIDNVSLAVESKEFLGIIGPNGAGKSTLLRLMCGILEPESGHVALFGQSLAGQTPRLIAQQVAFVPQETHFALNFTVEDIVLMGRYPYQRPFGRDKAEDIEATDQAINAAGIVDLRKRPVNSLSSGERQRVVLARAIAQTPRILLLDEPTSHLDLLHQYRIMELLSNLNARGLTVAVVHHDLNLASLYCRRLVVMHHGKVHCQGTPGQLLTEKILNEVYGTEVRIIRHPDKDVPQVFLHTEGQHEDRQ